MCETSFPSELEKGRLSLVAPLIATRILFRGGVTNLRNDFFFFVQNASIGQRAEQTGATKAYHRSGFWGKTLAAGQIW